jgi:hypothetical protein
MVSRGPRLRVGPEYWLAKGWEFVMRRFRGLSTGKVVGGTLVLFAGLFGAAPAFGSTTSPVAHAATSAPGKVSCSFSASVAFSPPLKNTGGGTHASAVHGKLSKCTATNSSVKIVSGSFGGSFARSPLVCKSDALTGASPTLIVGWKGDLNGKAASINATSVRGTKSSGSFAGPAIVKLNRPAKTPPACSTAAGLKTLGMSGTLIVGNPPKSGGWWKPTGDLPWQWVLSPNDSTNTFDVNSAEDMGTGDKLPNGSTAPNPVVYDIDGIENPASTVAALHTKHDHVICYMEVGTAGNYGGTYTTYYNELKSAGDLGNTLQGYSSENFININAPSAVAIVESIIKNQCAAKKFNGVETDLDETFNNNEGDTGFTITEANEESYMTTLAHYMHSLGLAWIIKNPDDIGDASYADAMYPLADAVLTEQCNQYSTCGFLSEYQGHKAIFNAEYSIPTSQFCSYDQSHGINGVLYDQNLDGGTRDPCPGP